MKMGFLDTFYIFCDPSNVPMPISKKVVSVIITKTKNKSNKISQKDQQKKRGGNPKTNPLHINITPTKCQLNVQNIITL